MNFFKNQEHALTLTFIFVICFILAVATLVVLIDALAVLIHYFYVYSGSHYPKPSLQRTAAEFGWSGVAMVSTAVITIIALATWSKLRELAGGGKAVAEKYGASLVPPKASHIKAQRLLNIVEEISVASALPVPSVYVLEAEPSINAFVAGYEPQDAAIIITQGTLDHLNREELQGVIAHEFSHIANGDMRLNTRLVGVLSGILIIASLGSMFVLGRGRKPAFLFLLGIGLWIIGFAGSIFGDLIKSAVARQREYLADAQAVQFTRNPAGLANALKRIGGQQESSTLLFEEAAEFNHAYFNQGITSGSSHPPIRKRIKAIEPHWDGKYLPPETITTSDIIQAKNALADGSTHVYNEKVEAVYSLILRDTGVGGMVTASDSGPSAVDYARDLLINIPEPYIKDAHDHSKAPAVILAAIANRKNTPLSAELLGKIKSNCGPTIYQSLLQLLEIRFDKRYCLPVVGIALRSISQISHEQYQAFSETLYLLINSDNTESLFEALVEMLVSKEGTITWGLDDYFSNTLQSLSYQPEIVGCCHILSCFAQHSRSPEQAFNAGIEVLGLSGNEHVKLENSPAPYQISNAVRRLNRYIPKTRAMVLKASLTIIHEEPIVSSDVVELFRGLSMLFSCPMPPLAATETC